MIITTEIEELIEIALGTKLKWYKKYEIRIQELRR